MSYSRLPDQASSKSDSDETTSTSAKSGNAFERIKKQFGFSSLEPTFVKSFFFWEVSGKTAPLLGANASPSHTISSKIPEILLDKPEHIEPSGIAKTTLLKPF